MTSPFLKAEFLTFTPAMADALGPSLALAVGLCLTTLACSFRTFQPRWLVPGLTLATLGVSAGLAARGMTGAPEVLFGGMLVADSLAHFFCLLFASLGALVVLCSYRYLQRQTLEHPEYFALILCAVLGMGLMTMSQELITLFLALELMSFAIYALVGFRRNDRRCNEASLKYFVLGSLASALYLYGAALVFGMTHSFQLNQFWDPTVPGRDTLIFFLGMWLILASFLFKVAAVPFHMWVPDVYEGAPTPITALMTTGVKVAAFGALLRIFLSMGPHLDLLEPWSTPTVRLLQWVAALTVVTGNLLALVQRNLKRLLAYSSIAHTGYLLIGFIAYLKGEATAPAILFYLVVYALMTMGAFALLSGLSGERDEGLDLESFAGMAERRPLASFLLVVFLLSLTGLPPTAGFVAKYQLFLGAVRAGETPLVVLAVLGSLLSVYYYLRVLVFAYMKEPQGGAISVLSRGVVATAAVLVVLILQIGLLPEPWIRLVRALAVGP